MMYLKNLVFYRNVLFEISRHISNTSNVLEGYATSRPYSQFGIKNVVFDGLGKNFSNKNNCLPAHNNIGFDLQNFGTKPELNPFSKEDAAEFMSYFPMVVKHLTEDQQLADIKEVTNRFADCLNYNVPTGKRVRGLTAVISYKYLDQPENQTPENIKLANILGWSVELGQSALIVSDDIMDKSPTRRNKACWHVKEGLIAISDAMCLNLAVYILLNKYMSSHSFFNEICDFSFKMLYYSQFGQTLDSFKCQLGEMTMERYKTLCKYKAGMNTFCYPVILGMYLSKTHSEDLQKEVMPILFDMGDVFQINNDVNDCFAEEVTGKHGNDIEGGKLTWLAVRALEKCSKSQMKVFEEHFGKPGESASNIIKNLYLELNLLDEYWQLMGDYFKSLQHRASCLKSPHRVLFRVLIEKYQEQVRTSNKSISQLKDANYKENF